MGPMRSTAVAVLVLSAIVSACSIAATVSTAPGRAGTSPTPEPRLGLTWAMAPDVERPADAFAVSSNPPTGPAHPNTAGHPGHFDGQAIIQDVAVSEDRLVGVGYVGLAGRWQALAWWSTDGLRWSLASIDTTPGSFAVAVAAKPGGRFVAVGRVGGDPAAWSSPDGATWTRATVGDVDPGPAAPAARMTAVIPTAGGWLAGGSAGPELGDRHARFWRSADGSSWAPLADDDGFAGAEVASIVGTAGGYVALGRLGTGQRWTASIAWTSVDGATWRRIADPALAGGLAVALAATPAGLLAVGSDLDEREAVAWSSTDGRTWTRAPIEASRLHFGEKIRLRDVLAIGSGFVGIGNFVGVQYGTGTSWLTTDGLAWARAPDQPPMEQGEPEAIVEWRDRLVVVGSRGAPDNYIPTVWLSPGLPTP